jgi:sugar lactone lactonase YvrE
MAFRKALETRPQIAGVTPYGAIPGGEFQIRGKGLAGPDRPRVRFGEAAAPVVFGSDSLLIVRVPEGATASELIVGIDHQASAPYACGVGVQIAEGLHPVANPVVDKRGNIYTTFSGSPGQKAPVSIYKVEAGGALTPLVSDLMNATGLALDSDDMLYVSSRHEGTVYRVSAAGSVSVYVEGMGVATGLAFDREGNLYVGDRSGTVFKVSSERQIYVFATLEPSIAAYHLAFGPDGYLYVAGPTTSSFDVVHRISPAGHVETFYRGLGRPQGMAFDAPGNVYVAASLGGRRGVVRIAPDAKAELFLSGPSIVGLAFTPSKSMVLATASSLYRVNTGIAGRPLP